MSRTVPWRNKPTPLITQMIPEAKDYRLYLVNEIGPTSFVFKDEHGNKFKVTAFPKQVNIGLHLKCSCDVVENDHCIHTLYVLLKKYKVDENNPIIWQASYLDSQLQAMVQMKYSKAKKPPMHKFLKKSQPKKKQEEEVMEELPDVAPDESCPICYELLQGQFYTQCDQCRNCIHCKCLKVWVTHKMQTKSPVTCPLCRLDLYNPLAKIAHDLERWKNKFMVHKNTKCQGCGVKNIKGLLFCCCHCNVQLCRQCYQFGVHQEHEPFLLQASPQSKWMMAPSRQGEIGKKIQQTLQAKIYILDAKSTIVKLFKTLKAASETQQMSHEPLSIVGNQVKLKLCCCKCGNNGDDLMLKLACNHNIHKECLSKMVQNDDFECSIDGGIIGKGLLNVFGIKLVKKQTKKMAEVLLARNLESTKFDQPTLFMPIPTMSKSVKKPIIKGNNRTSSIKKSEPKQLQIEPNLMAIRSIGIQGNRMLGMEPIRNIGVQGFQAARNTRTNSVGVRQIHR